MLKWQEISESEPRYTLQKIFEIPHKSKLQEIFERQPTYTLHNIFGYNPKK
jgi:hypothetical protein